MRYESYASLEQGIRILRVPLKCLFCIHIYEFSDPFSFLYHITSTIIAIKVCPFYNVERICAIRNHVKTPPLLHVSSENLGQH